MRPVRIVHLGLGGFFRAHQAWYTGAAPDAADWGIAAFTGRSRKLADDLSRQDGRYTLVVRAAEHDEMSVQHAVVAASAWTTRRFAPTWRRCGHDTIAEAVTDPVCRRWLDQWWDEASRHVPLPADDLVAYRAALLDRFANPRIRHTLAQIAADGSQKLPIRVLPVVRAERAAGRMPHGAVRILVSWIDHLRGIGAPINDAGAGPYRDRAGSARDVIALLAPELADDEALISTIDDGVQHS